MNLLGELRYSLEAYLSDAAFTFKNVPYTVVGGTTTGENPPNTFIGYVQSMYKANGIVFACNLLRSSVFSEARFLWQKDVGGVPGDLVGDPQYGLKELQLLSRPWPNGTTGELLYRMDQDTSLAGNFYAVRETGPNGDRLRRLRPDWVTIVLSAPAEEAVQSDVVGYKYQPGGQRSKATPIMYTVDEVAHWSPIPDPEAQYRGMSWLTPILREVQSDKAMIDHKQAFLDNAATPQMVVKVPDGMSKDEFAEFVDAADRKHAGYGNAYKTLYLGGGADAVVVGKDLAQIDFKEVQGAGETRICVVARVPPVLVGISEGLKGSALNAGNYTAARRGFASGTMRPLWRSACAALEVLLTVPRGCARLWYDDRDIDFLNEDRTDMANVQQTQAVAMLSLVNAGWEPDSVTAAIDANDWHLLKHTGLYSVQLQPPGEFGEPGGPGSPASATPADSGSAPAAPAVKPADHASPTTPSSSSPSQI